MVGCGNLGRRSHPRQSGLGISHIALPAFHRNHGEVGFLGGHPFLIEIDGEFAGSEAIHIRNGIFTHHWKISFFHQIAFHFVATHGIRAVEHHKFFAIFGTGFHTHAHCGIEGVGAATNVLNVVNQHINVFEHCGGGLVGFAVKWVSLYASFCIHCVAHCVAGVCITTHAVFGTIKCHQFHSGRLIQNVDGGFKIAVHTAGIGHQTHALALQLLKAAIAQHFNAGFYLRGGKHSRSHSHQR